MRKLFFILFFLSLSSSFSLISLNLNVINKTNLNQTINTTIYYDIYHFNQTIPSDVFDFWGSEINGRYLSNVWMFVVMNDGSYIRIGNFIIKWNNSKIEITDYSGVDDKLNSTNLLIIEFSNDSFYVFSNNNLFGPYKSNLTYVENLTVGLINSSRMVNFSEEFFGDPLAFFDFNYTYVLLTFPISGNRTVFNLNLSDPVFGNNTTMSFNYEKFHSAVVRVSNPKMLDVIANYTGNLS